MIRKRNIYSNKFIFRVVENVMTHSAYLVHGQHLQTVITVILEWQSTILVISISNKFQMIK